MKNRIGLKILLGGFSVLLLFFACDDPLDTLRVFSLTIEIDGNGTVDPAGLIEVNNGEVLDILATPDSGYSFDGWEVIEGSGVTFGSQSEADTSVTLSTENATIRAVFAADEYQLNISISGEGTTSPTGSVTVFHDIPIDISAAPIEGWNFDLGWSVESGSGVSFGNSSASSTTVTLTDGNATIRAGFQSNTQSILYLTVTNDGNGTTSPPSDFAYEAVSGEPFSISAIPDADFYFLNWTKTAGSGSVDFADENSDNTTVTISDGNATVQANFYSDIEMPVFSPSGATITNPLNVIISTDTSDCTIKYTTDGSDPIISISVVSGESGTSSTELTVDDTMTIKAYAFRPHWIDSPVATDSYTMGNSFFLGISDEGNGSGSIDTVNSTNNGVYTTALSVTAQTNPAVGCYFNGWYDNNSGGTLVSSDDPYVFSLAENTSLYARFEKIEHIFTLQKASDGSGYYFGELDTENSSANGTYFEGTSVVAQAVVGTLSLFMGWYDSSENGILVSTDNPYTFDLSFDTTLYAKFSYNTSSYFGYYGTFPTGTDDAGTGDLTDPGGYYLGQTEVTYELWATVYNWAVLNSYSFQNPGSRGGYLEGGLPKSYISGHELHPVTKINWRDAMVWCNALTELYNLQHGTSFSIVYNDGGTPIRDSRSTNAAQCDNVVQDTDADGFRLPLHIEWEAVARLKHDNTNGAIEWPNGSYWSPGNYASGASAAYTDSTATSQVAVYDTTSTSEVHSKNANAYGRYDMSGNVEEWLFNYGGGYRYFIGGSFSNSAYSIQIGTYSGFTSDNISIFRGFRIARD